MKITKEQGRVCREVYEKIAENPGKDAFDCGLNRTRPTLSKLGWCSTPSEEHDPYFDSGAVGLRHSQVLMALAFAITLSGVELEGCVE